MSSITLKLGSLFSVLVIGLSCARQPVEIGEITNIKVIHANNNGIECTADVSLNNKSLFPFTIENGELTAFIDETEIGVFTLTNSIQLSSFEKKIHPIKFSVVFKDADVGITLAMNSLLGRKNKYNIRGTIQAKSYFVHKKILIDKSLFK